MYRFLGVLLWLAAICQFCSGRKHLLSLKDDKRSLVVVTSFGYLEGGDLEVNITNLKITSSNLNPLIGFTFDKSNSTGISSYVERRESKSGCVLSGEEKFEDVPRAVLRIELEDLKTPKYRLTIKERLMNGVKFCGSRREYESQARPSGDAESPKDEMKQEEKSVPGKEMETKDKKTHPSASEVEIATKTGTQDELESNPSRRRRAAEFVEKSYLVRKTGYVEQESLPISGTYDTGMNISFYVRIETKEQIGLYELYFHNCHSYNKMKDTALEFGFTANIVEKNLDNYLSAGDVGLPGMYGLASVIYFIAGIVWIWLISSDGNRASKIHRLMAVVVMLKGLSAMFHALDYYFIAKDGTVEVWRYFFYTIHLLKGIVLFICLLLIATGWDFTEKVLRARDKILFVIVITMQVTVNVSYIFVEEMEKEDKFFYTWKNTFILIDILSCGVILIPVYWSIRYFQKASLTDGSTSNTKLFRHFMIMISCYLYLTRIVSYLLEITLPFQYIWVSNLFDELCLFVFLIITGYKFRPGCNNSYLKLSQHDGEEDQEEAITQSHLTNNLMRVNKQEKGIEEVNESDGLIPEQITSKV